LRKKNAFYAPPIFKVQSKSGSAFALKANQSCLQILKNPVWGKKSSPQAIQNFWPKKIKQLLYS